MSCSWPDIKEPKLKSVNLELTSHCNLACWFCLNPTKEFREKGFISDRLISKIVNELHGNTKIMLCGIGEPALHPGFEQIVEILCKKFKSVSVVTNGYLLTDEKLIRNIVKNKVEKIFLSLDYLDDEDINKHKGAPHGYLNKIFNGLEKLEHYKKELNSKIFTQINFLYDGKKGDNIFLACHKKLTEVMSENWCMYIRMIKTLAGQVKIDLLCINDEYHLVEKFHSIESENITIENWSKLLNHVPNNLREIKSCRHIYSYYMLLWDGSVVPCCNDFNGSAIVSNVLNSNENLNDLFYSQKYNALRKDLDNLRKTKIKICQNCTDFYKA